MATKKKTKKKSAKSKAVARKKSAPKKAVKRPKKSAMKKPSPKKATKKKTTIRKAAKEKTAAKKLPRARSASPDPVTVAPPDSWSRSEESGDLQGLSRRESADSESVDELVEEGNAFEAEVVAGVERAGDEEEKEVHTREVPEDDVPGEYLDKD